MPGVQPEWVDAVFYVQLRAKTSQYQRDAEGNYVIEAASLSNATVTKPTKPKGGTVMARLTVRIPTTAFLPLMPKAIIVIPADLLTVTELQVVATAVEASIEDGQ